MTDFCVYDVPDLANGRILRVYTNPSGLLDPDDNTDFTAGEYNTTIPSGLVDDIDNYFIQAPYTVPQFLEKPASPIEYNQLSCIADDSDEIIFYGMHAGIEVSLVKFDGTVFYSTDNYPDNSNLVFTFQPTETGFYQITIKYFPFKDFVEIISAGTAKNVSDSIALTDSVSKTWYITVPDTITIEENMSEAIQAPITDTIAIIEDTSITAELSATDLVNISDEIEQTHLISIADTTNLADSTVITATQQITDTVLFNEDADITVTLSIGDNLAIAENIAIAVSTLTIDFSNTSETIFTFME